MGEGAGTADVDQLLQPMRMVIMAVRHHGSCDAHAIRIRGLNDRRHIPRWVDHQRFPAGDANDITEVPERPVADGQDEQSIWRPATRND